MTPSHIAQHLSHHSRIDHQSCKHAHPRQSPSYIPRAVLKPTEIPPLTLQHNVLHTHLAAFAASQSSSLTTSITSLPSSSPVDLRERRSSLLPNSPSPPIDWHQRHTQSPNTTGLSCGLRSLLEEEKKLITVNQQIKATLTDLLNCEGVKQDRQYCLWVQRKLMDAERELREGRRHSVYCCTLRGSEGSWEVDGDPLQANL